MVTFESLSDHSDSDADKIIGIEDFAFSGTLAIVAAVIM